MRIAIPSNVGMTDARSSRQMWKPAATVGGHWELAAVASTKAVLWGMHVASLLMHLFARSLILLLLI